MYVTILGLKMAFNGCGYGDNLVEGVRIIIPEMTSMGWK